MRRKKNTTIVTFESRERTTIRGGVTRIVTRCENCGTEVLMVTPNEAAARTGADSPAIFRGIESGEIHFVEGEYGLLLVCLNSVSTRSEATTDD